MLSLSRALRTLSRTLDDSVAPSPSSKHLLSDDHESLPSAMHLRASL
ncbi:MAG: hypothetical protein RXP86_11420 [Acidilobus sp.]